jgi:hypothetical protein
VPAAVIACLAGALAAPAETALPEGNAYVRTLVQKQREREGQLDRYRYDAESLEEELDKSGAVRSRRTQRFETFHVKGRAVNRRVGEDGRPLGADEQAREDKRVAERVAELERGKTAAERDGVDLSAILERFDFKAVAREPVDGRPAVVLDFAARVGDRDIKGDALLRRLTGRIWVDEADQAIVRAEMRNTEPIKIALGLGASVARFESRLHFRKVDELWLPSRSETLVEGRKLLVKGFRTRLTVTYSGFRADRAAPGG